MIIKWFSIFFFLFATFVQSDGSGGKPWKPRCDSGYTYQAVYNTSGIATYGCVPKNKCEKGITNDCSKCCADYSNCTVFEYILGEPYFECGKCYIGFTKNCTPCCKNYGYSCHPAYYIFGAPAEYTCVRPKPKGSNYYCGDFCPVGSSCGKYYRHPYRRNRLPYFYCR